MNDRIMPFVTLLAMGVGWGITMPLAKIAVSTGHQPFGLIFWQLVIVTILLVFVTWIRGKPIRLDRRYMGLFFMVAVTGTVLPDVFFYLAAMKLPAGLLAILMSTSPMFGLAIALALGNDRFSWTRLLGLMFGLIGVIVLIGPGASLPDPALTGFVIVALLAPALYATQTNLVALWGTDGLDPVQTLIGASLVGVVISLPLAIGSGQWINPAAGFGKPEAALVAGAAIHGVVYAGYVWLIGRAGSVFTAQSAYIVTSFGVIWSIVLLGESYSPHIWATLGLMMMGVFLVQPHPRIGLAPAQGLGENDPNGQRKR